jgi:hypothetical protein
MANPFELRFKLLEMSTEFLEHQAAKQQELALEAWNLAQEQGTATIEFWKSIQPASYTVECIKSKAEELYGLVKKK